MQVRGAARVILIDNVADRLSFAQSKIPGLEIIDFNKVWQLADTLHCTVSAGIAQYQALVNGICNVTCIKVACDVWSLATYVAAKCVLCVIENFIEHMETNPTMIITIGYILHWYCRRRHWMRSSA